MAHDAHHAPGEPPPILDEAADSPLWLPAVGLSLLLLGAVLMVWRGATDDERLADIEAETFGFVDEAPEDGEAAVGDEAGDEAGGEGAGEPGGDGHDHAGHDHAH